MDTNYKHFYIFAVLYPSSNPYMEILLYFVYNVQSKDSPTLGSGLTLGPDRVSDSLVPVQTGLPERYGRAYLSLGEVGTAFSAVPGEA
jgi:hypothetical protein